MVYDKEAVASFVKESKPQNYYQSFTHQLDFTVRVKDESNSTADADSPPNRAPVTLWHFLLELLLAPDNDRQTICWTNSSDGEFRLVDPERVAVMWGRCKNKTNMTYDKLSRALRYYYDKNIIKKVMGQKFVYKFVSFPEVVKTENKVPFRVKMESLGALGVSGSCDHDNDEYAAGLSSSQHKGQAVVMQAASALFDRMQAGGQSELKSQWLQESFTGLSRAPSATVHSQLLCAAELSAIHVESSGQREKLTNTAVAHKSSLGSSGRPEVCAESAADPVKPPSASEAAATADAGGMADIETSSGETSMRRAERLLKSDSTSRDQSGGDRSLLLPLPGGSVSNSGDQSIISSEISVDCTTSSCSTSSGSSFSVSSTSLSSVSASSTRPKPQPLLISSDGLLASVACLATPGLNTPLFTNGGAAINGPRTPAGAQFWSGVSPVTSLLLSPETLSAGGRLMGNGVFLFPS